MKLDRFSRLCSAVALLAAVAVSSAGEVPVPVSGPGLPGLSSGVSTNLAALKEMSPGIFALGQVRLDKQQRTVSFPAVLNMAAGGMEYFLVTTYGKKHESILRTDASPSQIHVAMLLLDAHGAGTNRLTARPSEYGGSPGMEISGDPLTIELRWQEAGKEIARAAEDMILNQATQAGMGKGRWIYNGSALWEGKFLAQQSGSLISLISDPVALVNNALPDRDAEHGWCPNPAKLPPANTPVQVTFKLSASQPVR